MISATELSLISFAFKYNNLNKKIANTKSIYLTNSFEQELSVSVYNLLIGFGVMPYLDFLDEKRNCTNNKETSVYLKRMIKKCDKFILMLHEKSYRSAWSYWELGIAEQVKSEKDAIAIFPIATEDAESNFHSDFFDVYPTISFDKQLINNLNIDTVIKSFFISYPNNDSKITLQEWLIK